MTENIRIAIRDSTDSFNICFFDNEAGIKYHVADLNRFLAGSASILTLRYYSKAIDTIRAGCKLSFSYKSKDYWLNILDIKKIGLNVELTAFSTNLEANNELVSPYKATVAETIASYIKRFDAEKSFDIGINEVSGKSIKLEWTGKETVLARLYSVANNFDAELEFVTELNDDYSLKRHILNIYKKGNVGSVINSPVRVGKDLKVINYEESIKELYTAVRGKGKDGLTIAGLDKKVYDEKGNLIYYSNSDTVYAPQARDRYPSIGKQTDDGYTLMLLDDSEYSTKEDQYAYMLGRLKEISQPKVTFTAEGGFAGEIGDTRILIDDIHYEPELYVQARIIETVESLLTGQTSKTVFSNFERKYSQLSDDLLKRVEELAKEAIPYTLELATNNGTVFKNGAGNSQITPTLKRGSETISGASFVWTINGTSTTASTYTVTADAVSGTAVVKVEAVLAGKAVVSTEITFTNVEDGRDGRDGVAGRDGVGLRATSVTYGLSSAETIQPTSWTAAVPTLVKGQHLWTKTVWTYTDNTSETGYTKTYIAKDGNNGTDGIAGKDGVGIKTTTITYAKSTNGTTAPTSGWTATVPSVSQGQYLWTKTVWTYTDNTSETGYSVARMGEAGPKGDPGVDGLQGPRGEQGIPGQAGADGKTSYTHLAYATANTDPSKPYATVSGMVAHKGAILTKNGPEHQLIGGTDRVKSYQSFTETTGKNAWMYLHVKNTHSTNNLGIGFNGFGPVVNANFPSIILKPGETTIFMKNGFARNTYNFAQVIFYAPAVESDIKFELYALDMYTREPFLNFSLAPFEGATHIGMYVDNIELDSQDFTKYRWSQFRGADGSKGTPGQEGADGKTPYLHIAYATNASGTAGFSTTDSVGKTYIGQYTDFVEEDPTDPALYKWTLIQGPRGEQGIPGQAGANAYFFVAYADSPNGASGFSLTDASKRYMGHYSSSNPTQSTSAASYKWIDRANVTATFVQSTAPANPPIGSRWKYTGTTVITANSSTINPGEQYLFIEARWVKDVITSDNLQVKDQFINGPMIKNGAVTVDKLNVGNLSAISANLGNVTAGKMLLQRSFNAGRSEVPAYNYPAHKTGLFVDNFGVIANGGPVQRTINEAVASDMPVVAVTSGEIRFLRANLTDNIEEVLHTGLADPDFGYIQFGRDIDGKNALVIEANGQVYLKGENYTDWARSTVNSNVRWKVQGNLVIVDYDVTFPTGGTKHIVTVPKKYVPKALMLTAKAWHTFLDRDRNAQLNADGGLHILATDANQRYCGQILWSY